MMVPALSAELAKWATGAGMEFRGMESSGTAYFANGGGEYIYCVRSSSDDPGWYVVTKSSRQGEERFMFSASAIGIVEKFFWVTFGAEIRSVLVK